MPDCDAVQQEHRVGDEKKGSRQDPGQRTAIPWCPCGTMTEWKVVVGDVLPVVVEQCLIRVTGTCRRHNGKLDKLFPEIELFNLWIEVCKVERDIMVLRLSLLN